MTKDEERGNEAKERKERKRGGQKKGGNNKDKQGAKETKGEVRKLKKESRRERK